MIGEDFRSQAFNNLLHSQSLEQRIEELQGEIKKMGEKVDEKEMALVMQEHELETFQMSTEENLTHYDLMREDRDRLQSLADSNASTAAERAAKIEQIVEEFETRERNRLEGKKDNGT